MTSRFRTPLAIALAVGLSVTVFAACSSDDSKSSSGDTTTTSAGASSDSNKDDSTASDSTESSDSASVAEGDICVGIDATQVGLIVSATVTKNEVPGGGCNFAQDDPRTVSISFNTVEATSDSDFDMTKTGAIGAGMDDPTLTDPGIGAKSVIATGTVASGSNQQAIGIMQDGDTIVTVTVAQSVGLDADQVTTMASQALSLAEQDI
jgi:hypothetical protein